MRDRTTTADAPHSRPDAGNQPPRATLVIEWENALDARDTWVRLALERLAAEVERIAQKEAPPPVIFVYDAEQVSESAIAAFLVEVAPSLMRSTAVRLVPNPGLTYYELKNYGARLTETEAVVFIDSDTGPVPGWYDAILRPLEDPAVPAAGGMTILGLDNLRSRVFALTWFYKLEGEGAEAEKRGYIHANNVAVRRRFFLQHPFPELPAFKQGQKVWQDELRRAGYRLPVTAEAKLIHAPPTATPYWAKRAWNQGGDRDFVAARRFGGSRLVRLVLAPLTGARMWLRALGRIVTRRRRVELPLWAVPFAFALATAYELCALAGQVTSALHRSPGTQPSAAPLGSAAD